MEEDILNYLPTVMFRWTPCINTALIQDYKRRHVFCVTLYTLYLRENTIKFAENKRNKKDNPAILVTLYILLISPGVN